MSQDYTYVVTMLAKAGFDFKLADPAELTSNIKEDKVDDLVCLEVTGCFFMNLYIYFHRETGELVNMTSRVGFSYASCKKAEEYWRE